MQFNTRAKRKLQISITSLIDVLFLLLIFLMISSTFLEQPGIKLELPEAQSAMLVEQREFVLSVKQDGGIYLNDVEIQLAELEGKMKEVLPQMKDRALILKADQDVSHGLVVKVMDAAKNAGVKKLVIGTKLK